MNKFVPWAVIAAAFGAGWLLGGDVNIGTALFTFGIGPVVQYFLPRLRMRADTTALASAH